jgi:hypothetical protein
MALARDRARTIVIAAVMVTRMITIAGTPIARICWTDSLAPRRTIPSRSSFSAENFSPGARLGFRIAGQRPTIRPSRIATVTSETTAGRKPVVNRATAASAIAARTPGARAEARTSDPPAIEPDGGLRGARVGRPAGGLRGDRSPDGDPAR